MWDFCDYPTALGPRLRIDSHEAVPDAAPCYIQPVLGPALGAAAVRGAAKNTGRRVACRFPEVPALSTGPGKSQGPSWPGPGCALAHVLWRIAQAELGP